MLHVKHHKLEQLINESNASREALDNLKTYVSLLAKWNSFINLIGPYKDTEEIWERHILDCAQLCKYIKKDQSIIDIGSGAGLPGIILSILGYTDITLIESDKRKFAFLEYIIFTLKLNTKALNSRLENVINIRSDILISRALCTIEKLLNHNKKVSFSEKIITLKGKNAEKEITIAKRDWNFNYNIYPSITFDEGSIVELYNITQKDEA